MEKIRQVARYAAARTPSRRSPGAASSDRRPPIEPLWGAWDVHPSRGVTPNFIFVVHVDRFPRFLAVFPACPAAGCGALRASRGQTHVPRSDEAWLQGSRILSALLTMSRCVARFIGCSDPPSLLDDRGIVVEAIWFPSDGWPTHQLRWGIITPALKFIVELIDPYSALNFPKRLGSLELPTSSPQNKWGG